MGNSTGTTKLQANDRLRAALAARYGVPVSELPPLKPAPERVAPAPAARPPNPLRAAAIAAEKEVIATRLAAYEANRKAMHRRAMQMRETLAERFPNCFKGFGQPKLPLKIRIEEDIYSAAPDLDRGDVCNALTDYARGASYQRAMIEGAARVDLDGNPGGLVNAGAVKLAAKRLRRLAVSS